MEPTLNIALLIVDMQKCFLKAIADTPEFRNTCEHINHVSELLRTNKQTVIHVQDIESADELSEAELDFVKEIHINQDDLKVKKYFSNAFWQTDIEKMLTDRRVGLVVVAGFAAENCVLFTYNGAMERGFKAAMLQNGISSNDKINIQNAYQNRHTISYPVIEYLFNE